VSYGQTGSLDTVTCYNNQELKRIANKVVYANECSKILNIADEQLSLKDSVIGQLESSILYKDSLIFTMDSIIFLKDTIITVKEKDLNVMIEEIKKVNKKLKWTKVGWISTAAGMFVLLVAALF
jgi:hypothetical protein